MGGQEAPAPLVGVGSHQERWSPATRHSRNAVLLEPCGQLVDPFRNGCPAQVLAPYNVGCFGAALGDPVFTLYEPQELELVVYATTGKRVVLLANGQPDIQVDFFVHSWLVGTIVCVRDAFRRFDLPPEILIRRLVSAKLPPHLLFYRAKPLQPTNRCSSRGRSGWEPCGS